MRIHVVMGNPPYNEYEVTDGHVSSTQCIYYRFMGLGISDYESLIVPARWISDIPKGIHPDWLYRFRTRKDIEYLVDYKKSGQIFDNVDIKGGVCYYLLNKEFIGITHRKTIDQEGIHEWDAKLCIKDDIAFRDYMAYDIVSKIDTDRVETLDSRISGTNPFMKDRAPKCKFSTNWDGYKIHKDEVYNIKCFGKKIDGGFGWVSREQLDIGKELVDKHKLLLDNVTPLDDRVITEPIYAEPGSVCLNSWHVLTCSSKEEADHFKKYLMSKTVRYLISCIKNTVHASKSVYRLVPIPYDIDWDSDIDEQLYKIYNLSKEEIDYINRRIR